MTLILFVGMIEEYSSTVILLSQFNLARRGIAIVVSFPIGSMIKDMDTTFIENVCKVFGAVTLFCLFLPITLTVNPELAFLFAVAITFFVGSLAILVWARWCERRFDDHPRQK